MASYLHQQGRDDEAWDLLMLNLGMLYDLARDGTFIYVIMLTDPEKSVFAECRKHLSDHQVSASHLQKAMRRMERLEANCPRLRDALTAERIRVKMCMIAAQTYEVGGTTIVPDALLKHGFSRTVMIADALENFDNLYNRMMAYETVPGHQQVSFIRDVAIQYMDAIVGNPLLKDFERHVTPVSDYVAQEYERETQRGILKIALAAALFAAEQGRFPTSVKEMVPRYPRDAPLCPMTGKPFLINERTIASPSFTKPDETWTVKRRDKQ